MSLKQRSIRSHALRFLFTSLVISGLLVRFVAFQELPGFNGDELYWAVEIGRFLRSGEGSILTPSGRPPDLITLLNGSIGYALARIHLSNGYFRLFYMLLNMASVFLAWKLLKEYMGNRFSLILVLLLSTSPVLILMIPISM